MKIRWYQCYKWVKAFAGCWFIQDWLLDTNTFYLYLTNGSTLDQGGSRHFGGWWYCLCLQFWRLVICLVFVFTQHSAWLLSLRDVVSSLSLRLIHNITLPFQDGVGLGLEESVPDDGWWRCWCRVSERVALLLSCQSDGLRSCSIPLDSGVDQCCG